MFRRVLFFTIPFIFAALTVCRPSEAADAPATPVQVSSAATAGPVQPQAKMPAQKISARATEIDSLWDSGQHSKANKALDKWMKEEKNSPWPWVQAASMSYKQKKFSRALSQAKGALNKFPQCAEAYYWSGRSYEALNKPLDAANEYRAALLAEEKYTDAQEALNRVLTQLGS